jgi:ligand-binding sensor domain-containing protein
MVSKYLYTTVFILIFRIFNSHSQEIDFRFSNLSQREEMHNMVNCIYNDNYGYLWIGTANGLIKYNAYDLITYKHDNKLKNSLSNNGVHYIFEDADSNLFVGTEFGISLYNRDNDNFTSLIYDTLNSSYPYNNHVRYIVQDKNKNFWIASYGGGLYKLPPNFFKLSKDSLIKVSKQSNMKIGSTQSPVYSNCLLLYNDSLLFLGTEIGLYEFNTKKELVTYYYPITRKLKNTVTTNVINNLCTDKYGNIIISTWRKGVFILDPIHRTIIKNISSESGDIKLSSNIVRAGHIDKEQNLWLATYGGGINILGPDYKINTILQSKSRDLTSLNSDL